MARKKTEPVVETTASEEPEIIKGNHLTVVKWPSGRTTLDWDDKALLKEVQEAIAAYELAQKKPAVRAKAAVVKKKNTQAEDSLIIAVDAKSAIKKSSKKKAK
jgi:hypothetical protein